MDLKEYIMISTKSDVQSNLAQTLLMHYLHIATFLLFKIRIKANIEIF
jgi:hypothetical protein